MKFWKIKLAHCIGINDFSLFPSLVQSKLCETFMYFSGVYLRSGLCSVTIFHAHRQLLRPVGSLMDEERAYCVQPSEYAELYKQENTKTNMVLNEMSIGGTESKFPFRFHSC